MNKWHATVVRPSGRAGWLLFTTPNGKEVAVDLSERFLSLLSALVSAFEEDKHLPEPVRGWRSFDDLNETLFLERGSFSALVSQINKKYERIRQHLEDSAPRSLVETKRGVGYRIAAWWLTGF